VAVSVQNLPKSAEHKIYKAQNMLRVEWFRGEIPWRGSVIPHCTNFNFDSTIYIYIFFFYKINRLDVGFLSRDPMYSSGWIPKCRRNLLPRSFTQVTLFIWK
jgi:hypothetical protein